LSLSEWWFWEAVCFIAGKLGIGPLCVHTIAYQLVPVLYMIPLAIGIGLSVRIGTVLPVDVSHAKRLAAYAVLFTGCVGLVIAVVLYRYRLWIVSLFTTDPLIINGCDAIWGNMCIYVFFLFLFCINSAILRSLGLQWRVAATMILVLWCGFLPLIVNVCLWRGGGLEAMWRILPVTYAVLDVALASCYICADWTKISDGIREKARLSKIAAAAGGGDGDDTGNKSSTVHNEHTFLLEGDSERNKN